MCRALQEQGVDISVVTTDHDVDISKYAPLPEAAHEVDGIRTYFFPVQWGDSFKYSRPLANWLTKNVPYFDLVHIHAVFNHASVAAARACRKSRVPYIVRPLGSLDPWSMKQKSLKKTLFWQLAARRMLLGANAVHYTSRAEKERTENLLKLNHGAVIPLGIDAAPPLPPGMEHTLAMDFPELVDHPYVLVLSRLHPKKGLIVFLNSFLSLIANDQFKGWRLVLAGDGPSDYVAELKAMVKKHNAHEFVSFPGWLSAERKFSVLRGAALLALPSYQENFGVCVMEAMACGVSVLVSRHVNLAEEVAAATAGWVTDVSDESIRAALVEALGDAVERRARGVAGQMVANNFSWERVGNSLIELYTAALPGAASVSQT